MNVLIVTSDVDTLKEGTAARRAITEYATLVKHLFVIVLNDRREKCEMQKVSEELWIFPVNALRWWTAPFEAVAVARREVWFQGTLQADLVSALDPSEAGVAGMLISRFSRRPLQVHVEHDMFGSRFASESFRNWVRARAARTVVTGADGIRVVTKHMQDVLSKMGNKVTSRITLLPRFIDVSGLADEPIKVDLHTKYPHFKFLMLMVAPLIPEQNVGLGLEVLHGVLKFYTHAGLVIVGEGSEQKRLEKRIQELGLTDKVAFETIAEDLPSYYKTANVFLVTAIYDEYGDTIVAAAACGCPIVTTNVGVAANIIEHGDSGFLCDPSKPQTFVMSIVSMIRNPGIRERMKVNGELFIQDHIAQTKAEYLAQYAALWTALIKKHE